MISDVTFKMTGGDEAKGEEERRPKGSSEMSPTLICISINIPPLLPTAHDHQQDILLRPFLTDTEKSYILLLAPSHQKIRKILCVKMPKIGVKTLKIIAPATQK